MKIRQRMLVEVERFERCMDQRGSAPRNDRGLRQFVDYESRGIMPAEPDRYFERLLDGKRWWEWTLNEYAKSRFTDWWPGWNTITDWFSGDPSGLEQVRRRCGYYRTQEEHR